MELAQTSAIPSADQELIRHAFREEVERLLGHLKPREREVIELRFGLGREESQTLEEVGRRLKLSRERVRQIEARAKQKLIPAGAHQTPEGILELNACRERIGIVDELTTSEGQVSRVLVVDDMEAMRLALVKCLHMSGYEVIAASSGGEALELLRTQHFDLLLTDQTMPGLSGLELTDAVSRMHPDMPIVVLTGHTDVELAKDSLQRGPATSSRSR